MPDSAKNLVVLCDGTNNGWTPGPHETNVVKLSESLVISDPQRQIRYYDPGVGTPEGSLSESGGLAIRDRVRRMAGLAWGDGVWANVSEAYRFLMQEYRPGDRIYIFGFSRGAFTARAVAGVLHLCGLLRPWHENLIPSVIEIFRTDASTPRNRKSRETAGAGIRSNFGIDDPAFRVHFVGVWDTVETVGLSELLFDSRITSEPTVKPTYRHVRHAVALDELRAPYTPRLYRAEGALPAGHTYKQVWFCGAHCDVGGSYAEEGLSNAALHWMAREAYQQGLLMHLDALQKHPVNHFGLLHDQAVALPLWSLGWTFRRQYEGRGIRVHESVVERMGNSGMHYDPPLPAFEVERTLTGEIGMPDGSVARLPELPLRHAASSPPRVGLKWWHWAWLLLGAGATYALARCAPLLGCDLALLQLQEGWHGQLGQTLAAWSALTDASVTALLEYDFLFIVAYAALIPIEIMFALRIEGGVYPSALVAKALGFCGGWLIATDVLENLLTVWAMRWDGSNCNTWTCTALGWLVSFLESVASAAKFLFLAGFVLALAVCVLRGLVRLVSPRKRTQ